LRINFADTLIYLDWLYNENIQFNGTHTVSTNSLVDGTKNILINSSIATVYLSGTTIFINPATRTLGTKGNALTILPNDATWIAGSTDLISGSLKLFIGIQ